MTSYDIIQHDENQFSSTKLYGYLQNTHPSFHLFEEQDSDPELLITATRFYTDQRGRNAFFFNSSQIKQAISKCRNSVEKYYNNHRVSLKMHRNYNILANIMNGHFSFHDYDIDRDSIACSCFILTLGIAYGIDQSLFSPKMSNAIAGYMLLNSLIKANEKSFGLIAILSNDFHLIPSAKFGVFESEYCNHNIIIPDQKFRFDWSKISTIKYIISISTKILNIYQNILNEGDDIKLNIIFSTVDDMISGVALMKQNPLFNNILDQKIISFAQSKLNALQVFLRLKSEPLEILNTTVLNVYKADVGNRFHAFLNYDQFTKLYVSLTHDLREQLTSLSENGRVIEIDFDNPSPVYTLLKRRIAESESSLANYIDGTAEKIIKICKKITNTIVALITKNFSKIVNFISGTIQQKIDHLDEITQFNQSYQDDLDGILKELVKKKIITDFYSNTLSRMISEVANLKHVSNLVSLIFEMKRRQNDNIEFCNIELEIENRADCIHSYRIRVVI